MVNPMVLFLSFCFGLVCVVSRIHRAVVSPAPEHGANAAREGEPGGVGEGRVAESVGKGLAGLALRVPPSWKRETSPLPQNRAK